jgi:hypothetical protein
MQGYYKRFVRILLLFSFVSLMLCPYAEIITAGHGGKILLQQDDFKKNRKLVKNEYQAPQAPVFLKTPLHASAPFLSEMRWPHFSPLCQPIGLSITTTVQLLL